MSKPKLPDPERSRPGGSSSASCEAPACAPEPRSLVYETGENQPVPVVREPAAVYEVEAEPAAEWPWGEELENVMYSIRLPQPAGSALCARCRVRFSAAGPTGYAEDSPICDMCLLEGAPELGMVMALVAVVRAFGGVRPSSHGDYREALNELGAFCRIYERFAAKAGPARVFRLPGFGA